jgi:hypothetical protein
VAVTVVAVSVYHAIQFNDFNLTPPQLTSVVITAPQLANVTLENLL